MLLEPYLFFYGKTEEALDFYKKALGGGEISIMRTKDIPPESQMGGDPNAVMHSVFKGGGITFMASDGDPSTKANESNITLALTADTPADGERLMTALAADGGKITFPFANAFWGGKFGSLTDKFGIDWFISAN